VPGSAWRIVIQSVVAMVEEMLSMMDSAPIQSTKSCCRSEGDTDWRMPVGDCFNQSLRTIEDEDAIERDKDRRPAPGLWPRGATVQ